MTTTDIATRPEGADGELSIQQIVSQVAKIQECMQLVFKKDEHYGVIPGTGSADRPPKPTLLKPGAEKLCLMFRLDPEYDVMQSIQEPTRISYMVRCVLHHIPSGRRIASGLGSCNSREDKYVRPAAKKCPKCGKATIIKGNPDYERDAAYKGGWLCLTKKGGCGAKYKPGDEAIEKQDAGIKDPSDLDNTILKMACKRALVAAVLNGTAASDFFTQDLEDMQEKRDAIDVEVTPPRPTERYAPGGAAQQPPKAEASSSAGSAVSGGRATQSSADSAPTASAKRPRADQIKHDGTFLTAGQVKMIHTLRGKIGGLTVCTDKAPCEIGTSRACKYHQQLHAFKSPTGQPITSSKDLCPAQASLLIDRYQEHIEKQARRASEPVDIGPAEEPPAPSAKQLQEAATAATRDPGELDDLTREICAVFGCDSFAEMDKPTAVLAYGLISAHHDGPDAYRRALDSLR